MDGFPFRVGFLPVDPARPLLEFLGKMRMQRTVAMRTDRGRQRVIVGLGVVADDFHFLLDEPVAG